MVRNAHARAPGDEPTELVFHIGPARRVPDIAFDPVQGDVEGVEEIRRPKDQRREDVNFLAVVYADRRDLARRSARRRRLEIEDDPVARGSRSHRHEVILVASSDTLERYAIDGA